MNTDLRTDLRTALVALGVVIVVGVCGVLFTDRLDNPAEVDVDAIATAAADQIEVVDGVDGKSIRGPQGSAGPAGPAGPAGADGADGVVDYDRVEDMINDIIDENDDDELFSVSCDNGYIEREFEVDDDGVFRFEMRHRGSGGFAVWLEDEDGDEITVMNGSGNTTKVSSRTLNDNELYTLFATSDEDRSCRVTVTEN